MIGLGAIIDDDDGLGGHHYHGSSLVCLGSIVDRVWFHLGWDPFLSDALALVFRPILFGGS